MSERDNEKKDKNTSQPRRKVTTRRFQEMKQEGEPITMLTGYDYAFASIIDKAGIDSILVGDSLGMVVLGYENTLPVTLEDTLRHTQAVRRGTSRALVVSDMPFGTFGVALKETVKNASRFVKEGGAEAVKLEGGKERCDEILALKEIGIPVIGHIGLTPTHIHSYGGYKVQGKTERSVKYLLESAKALEDAGTFSIILEGIPWRLAKQITEALTIPTIGIGAGPHCDGQVLVIHDLLKLLVNSNFKPKFVKVFADIGNQILAAVENYREAVKKRTFPDLEHSYE